MLISFVVLRWMRSLLAVALLLIALAIHWGPLTSAGEITFQGYLQPGNGDLNMLDLQTGNIVRLNRNDTLKNRFTEYYSWSAGGEALRLVSIYDKHSNFFTMDSDGGDLELVTRIMTNSIVYAWSSDGEKIAYSSLSSIEGDAEVYVFDQQTQTYTNVSQHEAADYDPVWSPVDDRLVFISGRDSQPAPGESSHFNLYLTDADGTNLRALTDNTSNDTQPVWSPDGKYLAFSANLDGQYDIYTLNVETGERRRITRHIADDYFPAWSPDSKHIAFLSKRFRNWHIYIADMDGHVTRPTTHPTLPDAPEWSPDGRRLAFTSWKGAGRSSSTIFVVTRYGTRLHRVTPLDMYAAAPQWRP